MTSSNYIIAICALALVLSLIALCSFLIKRFGADYFKLPKNINKEKRIKIIEVTTIDTSRKLILFTRDNVEHLVLTSANGDILIEKDILKK